MHDEWLRLVILLGVSKRWQPICPIAAVEAAATGSKRMNRAWERIRWMGVLGGLNSCTSKGGGDLWPVYKRGGAVGRSLTSIVHPPALQVLSSDF